MIVQNTDLTICYDEKGIVLFFYTSFSFGLILCKVVEMLVFAGSKYELPKYVLRDPSNLIRIK